MRAPIPQADFHYTLYGLACVACMGALLWPTVAISGTPAATTERWANIIEPRALDCGGRTSVADPLNVDVARIRSDRFGNFFVSTGSGGPGVISFTANGRKRWEFSTCPEEADGGGYVQGWVAALPDGRGGAWVHERRSHWLFDLYWERLYHIDAHGILTATIDPSVHAGRFTSVSTGVIDDSLILGWTETRSPEAPDVQRTIEIDTDGIVRAQRDIARGDEQVVFGRAIGRVDSEERMLGFEEVLLSRNNWGHSLVLSRVTADNVAEHMVTLRGPWMQYVFAQDGTPWITQYEQPGTLTHLALDGTTTVVDITPTLSPAFDPALLSRPKGERFLLVGDTRLALLDTDGVVQQDIATIGHVPASYATNTPFGWFLPARGTASTDAATIYAFDDLQLLARFTIDLPVFDGSSAASPVPWDIAPDGSIVALDQRRDPDGIVRTRLVGFAVPGSAAEQRLLRDDFEP